MKLSRATKHIVLRAGHAAIGVWLGIVLFAYIGFLKLPGLLADLAALTVLVIIANMIWKYAVRPLFGLQSERL